MDLIDQLETLANNIEKQKDKMLTEEATKNAFVMPFIKALGYDIFNPDEVVPEFIADHGIKKGEKVDYAIFIDGSPTILIECKKYGINLKPKASSQLYRYYSVTDAKIGIVTDGDKYHFYTDLEKPNQMDDRPYMELDLLDLEKNMIPQLKKLTKPSFDLDLALATATELKYTKEIRRHIADLLENPTHDFVKFFTSLVYDARFTKKAKEQFTPLVKKAFKQYLRRQIDNRLETAFPENETGTIEDSAEAAELDRKKGIETTEEEIEGYYIVRSIVSEVVAPERVVQRDAKSYMAILLDDNNRRPICRLRFNTLQKRLSLFDRKKEKKVPIEKIRDIYKYKEQLKTAAQSYG